MNGIWPEGKSENVSWKLLILEELLIELSNGALLEAAGIGFESWQLTLILYRGRPSRVRLFVVVSARRWRVFGPGAS